MPSPGIAAARLEALALGRMRAYAEGLEEPLRAKALAFYHDVRKGIRGPKMAFALSFYLLIPALMVWDAQGWFLGALALLVSAGISVALGFRVSRARKQHLAVRASWRSDPEIAEVERVFANLARGLTIWG